MKAPRLATAIVHPMAQRWDSVLPYWDSVVRPLLTALNAGPLIEIGAASGVTTLKLAELASESGIALHVVEPEPQFDVVELERRFDGVQVHQLRSHEALERIEAPAAAIIDGDHNWYTVHGELSRLKKSAAACDRHFPLVMLHDVEWPYARRDLYYNPEAIPGAWRKPWDQRGILWGKRELSPSGRGVNRHLANAIIEGGPQNGVLTAVEDFMEECGLPLQLRIVRGYAGLGILACSDLLDAAPALRRQWSRLDSRDFLLEQAADLAEAASAATAARIEAEREVEHLRRRLTDAEGQHPAEQH